MLSVLKIFHIGTRELLYECKGELLFDLFYIILFLSFYKYFLSSKKFNNEIKKKQIGKYFP